MVFTFAARAIPSGGALNTSPIAGPEAGSALLERFKGADRAIVERGRSSPLVGTSAPSLTFRSFSGGTLAYDEIERVVILAFVGPECPSCASAVQKLATLSVLYYEDLYSVAVAAAGSAKESAQTITDVGGEGLVLGGEDMKDAVADGLEIKKRPTLIIVGPKGTVDAMWTEDVPLNVLYQFLKVAYEVDGEGEKPLEPVSRDGPENA